MNFICKTISEQIEPSQPAYTIRSQLGELANPLP